MIKKISIAEIIGLVIALAAMVVIVGWYLNITALKSILPYWVSMKFSTALAFLLSGIELCFIARLQRKIRNAALIVLPIASMIIMLFMVSLLAATFIGTSVGVEEFFVKDSMLAVLSIIPGRPSVATMINFILIALAGVLASFRFSVFNQALIAIGLIVGLIGITAVFGYIFNQPLLYFFLPGKSSAMAIHTAILFVLWAGGAIIAAKYK